MSYLETEYPGGARQAVDAERNLSDVERWGSMAAGTALALYGVSRRSLPGLVTAGLGAALVRRGITGHCDIYQTLGVSTAGSSTDTREALSGSRGVLVEESVTVSRSADELYRFWRQLENLPRFMRHLESVESLTDTLSRWRANAPGGLALEWTAEVINDVPGRVIGWRSLEGSDVVSAGSVNFEQGGDTTRLRVRLQYSPPGGKVGATVARLLGRDPGAELRHDLRSLKQLLESGHLSPTNGDTHL